jgi:hypothetical protein
MNLVNEITPVINEYTPKVEVGKNTKTTTLSKRSKTAICVEYRMLFLDAFINSNNSLLFTDRLNMRIALYRIMNMQMPRSIA